ncbi:hypothetical protein ACQPZG_02410 (plasmid) [Streptomyces sp. CA-294286]|uniref:hypothetical protein n=1 Tax=Streptomyces sp. CA-294286 TaxID=3240070 RepID=UPI003D94CB89
MTSIGAASRSGRSRFHWSTMAVRLRGRYLATHQLSWSACRTLAPMLLGFLLDAGPWQVWTVLALTVLTGAAVLLRAERVLPPHVVSGTEEGNAASFQRPSTTTASLVRAPVDRP